MIPVFEEAKMVHALDSAATAIERASKLDVNKCKPNFVKPHNLTLDYFLKISF
jgi:hypothetical protein